MELSMSYQTPIGQKNYRTNVLLYVGRWVLNNCFASDIKNVRHATEHNCS